MTPADLAPHVLALVREGGDDNRLVVEGGSGFLVLRAGRGDGEVQVAASGGRYLPDGVRLDGPRVGRLADAGLRQSNAASAFRGAWPVVDDDAARGVADRIVALLSGIYGHAGPVAMRTRHGDAQRFENKALVDSMRRLSKNRTMKARITVYNRLLNARLALLLDAPIADPRRQDDARLHVVEQLAGTDVVVAFTDDASLEHYDPRGRHTVLWTGRELFPLLAARKVGSLLLNPGAGVRGELYRNEILTISDGIKRQAGIH